ncbi:MAG: aspartate aminotransferase family protein [bacterium]|nr:aspartate aminotransferase family protein [bacterium]
MNDDLELIQGAVPGRHTGELTPVLRTYESRNVTYLGAEFPVFWESANGATITDVDGNRYIDLTSAFGVANVGHANAYVVAAVHDQATRLMHGMGDVHPTEVRTRLLERLTHVLPKGLSKTFLATAGSEAVEAALKTAMLATGKHRFAAYRGAYHGLSLGALAVSGIEKFRAPFAPLVPDVTTLLDYPMNGRDDTAHAVAVLRETLGARDDLAALIVEPIQGRGGCIVPPPGYLRAVREFCSERGIVLIFDEIYTGFGRTGAWFAADHEAVVPDIICIGKAMGSGFPISAAVARPEIMDAWPLSAGEALHTSTYLGNPMGCAAALATIHELERNALPERARTLGVSLGERLAGLRRLDGVTDVRGRGFMWGVAVRDAAFADRIVKHALALGLMVLQAGPAGDVISITPPLVIGDQQLARAIALLEEAIATAAA